ncbi:Ig-like domain-containing protein, partial [Salmonella enterica subsp. enterica serovar Lubbock]|nr:Ig-like domain-containing protein [Salmonella enterica subsp. enterica serovar Lubbock]
WNYTWPKTLADDDYTLTVKATDNAGNTVTRTLDFTIVAVLMLLTAPKLNRMTQDDDTAEKGSKAATV